MRLVYIKQQKIDGEALLKADPPPANSSTLRSGLVRQERNLCLGGTAYLSGPAKSH